MENADTQSSAIVHTPQSIINIDDNDLVDLRRTIHSSRKTEEKDLDDDHQITFSDLMLFLNVRNDIGCFYAKATKDFIENTKRYLRVKKNSLEQRFSDYSKPISKWVNFITSRRDRKKILMKNGINFLNFMKYRVSADVYGYLVELYTTEKILILIKNYDLSHIVYDILDFENFSLSHGSSLTKVF